MGIDDVVGGSPIYQGWIEEGQERATRYHAYVVLSGRFGDLPSALTQAIDRVPFDALRQVLRYSGVESLEALSARMQSTDPGWAKHLVMQMRYSTTEREIRASQIFGTAITEGAGRAARENVRLVLEGRFGAVSPAVALVLRLAPVTALKKLMPHIATDSVEDILARLNLILDELEHS